MAERLSFKFEQWARRWAYFFSRAHSARWMLSISAILVLAAAFVPYRLARPQITGSAYIPLHYNVSLGVDQFGAWWWGFAPALFALIVLAGNTLIARRLERDHHLLSLLVSFTALLVAVYALAGTLLSSLLLL